MAVQLTSTYIHALDGRLRIKAYGVKNDPLRALAIARELRAVDGVNHVEANPITGNVLILYSSDRIGQHEIIDALRRLGCLQEHARDQTVRGSDGGMMHGFSAKLIETIVRSITELALQRLVSALI
jgi:copper chaperone CopZ